MKRFALIKSLWVIIMFFLVTPLSGQSVIRILTLGDSMIEGWMDGDENKDGTKDAPQDSARRKGFRHDLKTSLTNAGYQVDFVGSKKTGCFFFSDCENGGISGSRDQYIETMLINGWDERWQRWETNHIPYLDAFNPDVIFLNIGTNDITHEEDAITNQRVSAILDQVDLYEARSHKEVMVFLALIINRRLLPGGGEPTNFYTTHQWNLAIKAMAEQRIANGDKIVVVNLEEDAGINYAYNGGDMYINDPEGLHPSEKGYSKMAALFYQKFIQNYNQAPNITSIPDQAISEGSAFNNIPLDNYVSDFEDADQNLTWTFTQISTSNLNITINSNREAIISPKLLNWNGSQSVVFKVTDGGNAGIGTKFDMDTVIFSVTAVDDPPVINSQSTLTTVEDTPLTLKLSDFTITDPDSDPSTFQLIVLPGTNYTVAGTKITPAANFNGNLQVNTAVRDASNTGPTFAANVSVSSVNDAPEFVSQPAITINEDNSYVPELVNFTVSDPDNNPDDLTLVMLPGLHYTIEDETIIPDPNYNGVLYVESYIQDPLEAVSSVFYIEITVNPINDEPFFASEPIDSVEILKQYIYSISVSDPDQDNLSITIAVKPEWLTYYPNSKLLAGIPPQEAVYSNNIAISASDGKSVKLQSFILRVIGGHSATDNTIEEAVSVYPNPASDHITVKTGEINKEYYFSLFTVDGRGIMSAKLSGETTINFDSELKPGVYIYTIESAGKVIKGKLLKE